MNQIGIRETKQWYKLFVHLQMWPSLIAKAKEGGLEVIQTYVFWNLHEPQPGQVCQPQSQPNLQPKNLSWVFLIYMVTVGFVLQYDFSGRYDLVKFIKEIQAQGLYACLRIGPFIESEWTYGFVPFCLISSTGRAFTI